MRRDDNDGDLPPEPAGGDLPPEPGGGDAASTRPPGRMGLPPPPAPGSTKRRTAGGGYPLIGLAIGFFLGLILPPTILGFSSAIIQDGVGLVIGLVLAVAVPLAIYILILTRLDRSDPQQESIRVAMVVSGITSVAVLAGILLLVGACLALLYSAY